MRYNCAWLLHWSQSILILLLWPLHWKKVQELHPDSYSLLSPSIHFYWLAQTGRINSWVSWVLTVQAKIWTGPADSLLGMLDITAVMQNLHYSTFSTICEGKIMKTQFTISYSSLQGTFVIFTDKAAYLIAQRINKCSLTEPKNLWLKLN